MTTVPRPGQRIRLVAMENDPDPIMVGQAGTVISVRRHGGGSGVWWQIDIAWNNGRTLMLVSPPDEFEVVGEE